MRACAAVENPNIPKIYKEAVAKFTGKTQIFSIKTLRRKWKKVCEKAMLQTGLDKATMDKDTVLGIINGVKRYGDTGGNNRAFSDATETLLCTTIGHMREMGMIVSELCLLDIANYLKEKANKSNKTPVTREWLKSLLKRHPECTLKKVGGLDKQRVAAADTERMKSANIVRMAMYARLKREGKIEGDFPDKDQILNMDEMAAAILSEWGRMFVVDQTRTTTVSDDDMIFKADRQFFAKDGDKQEPYHVTAAITSCADGRYLPPFLIHSGSPSTEEHKQTITEAHLSNLPAGANVTVTGKGSMTQVTFERYAHHLVQSMKEFRPKSSTTGRPKTMILYVDGHASRWNAPALEYLRNNDIEVFCFPSHTSIWTQPNDLGVNKSLKAFIKKAATKYLRQSWKVSGLPRDEYNKVFTAGWEEFLKKEMTDVSKRKKNVAVRAFERAGISPHQDMPEMWLNAANTIGRQNDIMRGTTQEEGEEGAMVDESEVEDLVIGEMRDGSILSVNRAIHNSLFEFLKREYVGPGGGPKRKRNAMVATTIGLDCTAEETLQMIRKKLEDREAEGAAKEQRKKVREEEKVERTKEAAAEAERKKIEKEAKQGVKKKLVDDAVGVIRPLIQDGEVRGAMVGELKDLLIEAGITLKAVTDAQSAMTPKFMEGVWSSDEKKEADKWLVAAKKYLRTKKREEK